MLNAQDAQVGDMLSVWNGLQNGNLFLFQMIAENLMKPVIENGIVFVIVKFLVYSSPTIQRLQINVAGALMP